MEKGYSRRSKAIELMNGEYEKMVLRIEELEKENKLLKEKSDNPEKLIPANDAPKYIPVTMPTVRLWIKQGRLPVVRLGRLVTIKRSVIEKIQSEGLESVS
jgi:excisionase family DNA binding protein